MSIALNRNGNSGNGMIQRSGRFIHGMHCGSIYDSNKGFDQDHGLELENDEEGESSSTRSSSVGNNSDDESSEGEEVESKGPLDTMDQLEEVLPVKRGISKFYNGKSKSFTSLADASSVSTVKELAKPINPYNKKRKNLLASGYFRDLKNNGGNMRRAASSGRGMYLAEETNSGSNSGTTPNPFHRPPFLVVLHDIHNVKYRLVMDHQILHRPLLLLNAMLLGGRSHSPIYNVPLHQGLLLPVLKFVVGTSAMVHIDVIVSCSIFLILEECLCS